MTRSTKAYDEEFKKNAVQLAIQKGRRVVSIDLDVPESTLRGWMNKYRNDPVIQETAEAEVARLRLENAELREEREILKKSVAIFLKPRR